MIGKNSDKVVVIVTKDVKEKIDGIANRDGRSTSNYVARLIEKDIESKFKSSVPTKEEK